MTFQAFLNDSKHRTGISGRDRSDKICTFRLLQRADIARPNLSYARGAFVLRCLVFVLRA
jgi:hypothetical protein